MSAAWIFYAYAIGAAIGMVGFTRWLGNDEFEDDHVSAVFLGMIAGLVWPVVVLALGICRVALPGDRAAD